MPTSRGKLQINSVKRTSVLQDGTVHACDDSMFLLCEQANVLGNAPFKDAQREDPKTRESSPSLAPRPSVRSGVVPEPVDARLLGGCEPVGQGLTFRVQAVGPRPLLEATLQSHAPKPLSVAKVRQASTGLEDVVAVLRQARVPGRS